MFFFGSKGQIWIAYSVLWIMKALVWILSTVSEITLKLSTSCQTETNTWIFIRYLSLNAESNLKRSLIYTIHNWWLPTQICTYISIQSQLNVFHSLTGIPNRVIFSFFLFTCQSKSLEEFTFLYGEKIVSKEKIKSRQNCNS